MSERVIEEQIQYYRRRAAEYDATAYGALGPAAERIASVRFCCADILRWTPDRRYQLAFFGFWLSHVPSSRLASFFGMLRQSLTATGEVVFVDEHVSQASHERPAADPELVTRDLSDGTRHQVVKGLPRPAAARRPSRRPGLGLRAGSGRRGLGDRTRPAARVAWAHEY